MAIIVVTYYLAKIAAKAGTFRAAAAWRHRRTSSGIKA